MTMATILSARWKLTSADWTEDTRMKALPRVASTQTIKLRSGRFLRIQGHVRRPAAHHEKRGHSVHFLELHQNALHAAIRALVQLIRPLQLGAQPVFQSCQRGHITHHGALAFEALFNLRLNSIREVKQIRNDQPAKPLRSSLLCDLQLSIQVLHCRQGRCIPDVLQPSCNIADPSANSVDFLGDRPVGEKLIQSLLPSPIPILIHRHSHCRHCRADGANRSHHIQKTYGCQNARTIPPAPAQDKAGYRGSHRNAYPETRQSPIIKFDLCHARLAGRVAAKRSYTRTGEAA
ncbi:Uncharacterised protein [Achromobacter xylosoxidans]|nr:Uncharacterised protein [Achromobacter xylosoxidans]SQG76649.1 Uncharacterised protein [Achromobacter xylosoxidans]